MELIIMGAKNARMRWEGGLEEKGTPGCARVKSSDAVLMKTALLHLGMQ